MKVWILEQGERHEGGHIIGVYMDRELARGDFMTAAQRITQFGDASKAVRDSDGTLYVEAGCDWLSLTPYDVAQRPAIAAGD